MIFTYFPTEKLAQKAGLLYPGVNFKTTGVLVVQHKKKMISVYVKKRKWFQPIDHEDFVQAIHKAVREMSRIYPELR